MQSQWRRLWCGSECYYPARNQILITWLNLLTCELSHYTEDRAPFWRSLSLKKSFEKTLPHQLTQKYTAPKIYWRFINCRAGKEPYALKLEASLMRLLTVQTEQRFHILLQFCKNFKYFVNSGRSFKVSHGLDSIAKNERTAVDVALKIFMNECHHLFIYFKRLK